MKTKNLWRVWLMSLAAAVFVCFSACGGDDAFEPDTDSAPVNVSIPAENTGESGFSITIEGGGTGSGTPSDPAVAQCGDTLSVAITEKSTYTDPDGTVFTCEPKATVSLFTAEDTLYVNDLETLLNVKESSNTQSESTKDNIKTVLRAQKFNVGGKEISFDFSHEIYTYINSENTAIEMPYVKINPAEEGSAQVGGTNGITPVLYVKAAPARQKRAPAAVDSTTYEVTVSFTLELENVDNQNSDMQPLSFKVKFFGVVITGNPDTEKRLVAINYRKGYEWFEPHDNIPLTYCYILYRDSVFSDGSVRTSQAYTGRTSLEWVLDLGSNHGHYDQRKEDVEGVTVYYFAVQAQCSETDIAYCNSKASRKIAVPDISVVTLEKRTPDSTNPEQLDRYPGYDVSAPKPGWYWSDFFYTDKAYVCYNYAGGRDFLTIFNVCSRWYNHIIYVEDGLNGGQLVTFLGDENDIDDVDYRAQFDFSFTEEETTMPTGEPAKVFSHKCITTMLGRQFYYEVVDSVYQYDPAHPPF